MSQPITGDGLEIDVDDTPVARTPETFTRDAHRAAEI